jgi:urease accessory protein
MLFRIFLLFSTLIAISAGVHAHTDPSIHSGFLHPISGMDHFFVMVGVGIWASSIGGQAMWKLPLGFMTIMLVGGILGFYAVDVPFVGLTIPASVAVITGLW